MVIKKMINVPIETVLSMVTNSSNRDWAYHERYRPKKKKMMNQYPKVIALRMKINLHSDKTKNPNSLRKLKKIKKEATMLMKSLKNNRILSIPFGIGFSNVDLTENILIKWLL